MLSLDLLFYLKFTLEFLTFYLKLLKRFLPFLVFLVLFVAVVVNYLWSSVMLVVLITINSDNGRVNLSNDFAVASNLLSLH